ncbi:MAG TPA: exodeoxyribonuclease VII large subunit [Candidatus Methylomirabilis sp.]|nr:exodeoxyribonuclease VII large subunit [Candidatus Methylomirabilis sp.]
MRILSVSDFLSLVNETLKALADADEFAVEGEVSGYRVSQGQWVSFDLKDEQALVNVFLPVWKLQVPVEDGMKVRVFGAGRVYAKYGKFSLSAEKIEPIGEGALRKALSLLRQRLEKEGLFDPSRKRALPRFPSNIALIASRESAAYGDFIRVVGERWGGLEIDLYHVVVQGERAAQDIVHAIGQVQEGDYDALVMTRGGGSFEELMPFNDETLVRAIRASRIPTMVAIGHERDLSLAEEAADVRGSTPTDCARRLVPDRRDVQYELASLMGLVETAFMQRLEAYRVIIDRTLHAPGQWIAGRRTELEGLASTCTTGVQQWFRTLQDRFQSHVRLLSSLDPKRVLARGYAVVKDAAGRAVTSAAQLRVGADATVQLKDGEVGVTVTRIGKQPLQPKML